MKTLPHLKQITYAIIIVAFPFIFSASDGLKPPKVQPKPKKQFTFPISSPKESMTILQTTFDSLKNTGIFIVENN